MKWRKSSIHEACVALSSEETYTLFLLIDNELRNRMNEDTMRKLLTQLRVSLLRRFIYFVEVIVRSFEETSGEV